MGENVPRGRVEGHGRSHEVITSGRAANLRVLKFLRVDAVAKSVVIEYATSI